MILKMYRTKSEIINDQTSPFNANFNFLYGGCRVLCQNQMVKGDTEFTHILLKGSNLRIYQLQISPSFVMIQVTIQSRLKIFADIFELLVLHSKYGLEHTNMAFEYLFVIADIKWYRTVQGSMVHDGYLCMLGHQLLSKARYCGSLPNRRIQFPYLSSVRNIIALTKFIASHPNQCILEYKIKSRFLM